MKIGLLDAFGTEHELVRKHGSQLEMFRALIEPVDGGIELEDYDLQGGEFPDSINTHGTYLITGSLSDAYGREDWILRLANFIRRGVEAEKRFVGICFGHHLLAHALGGEARKAEQGWGMGLRAFAIHSGKQWMDGEESYCSLYFSHRDQVVQVPPGGEVIGGNEFCPIAVFCVRSSILGIQGHPEFSKEFLSDLILSRREILPADYFSEALASLETGKPDRGRVANWIVNFLKC